MEAELSVRNVELPLLKCCLERLLALYDCLSQVEEEPDGTLRLRLWTHHKTDDSLRRAQDFLLSVTSENPAWERSYPIPATEALAQLFSVRNDVERDARVIVRFSEGEVVARGPQLNVQRAMQLIEELVSATAAGHLLPGMQMPQTALKPSLTSDSLLSEGSAPALRMSSGRRDGRMTRRVESEDSSYDSDTECGLGPGVRGSQSGLHGAPAGGAVGSASQAAVHKHDDVCRTVSDTLGAEFAEYVSTEKVELKAVLADPAYQTRLEFALKLGYTEAQVQTALQRLGLSAANNELLAELIKLSSAVAKDEQSPSTTTTAGTDPGHPDTPAPGGGLRPIVIDGSNVAMSHGNKDIFSCRGIRICVDWFRARGHSEVTVFVPSWRKEAARANTPIADQEILLQLEREKMLVFTPSRNVGGKRLVCYEDRYVLKLAAETDGVVVSNDNYRDLVTENADFKKVVEERLLMYTFVNDRFMPPDDPLGRQGPTLDQFLRKASATAPVTQAVPPICPYAKKCTYGNKCKYYHPERGNMPQKSITERLAEQCKIQMQEVKNRTHHLGGGHELTRTRSVPVTSASDLSLPTTGNGGAKKKQPLSRTRSAAPSQRPQNHEDFNNGPTGSGAVNLNRLRPQDDVVGWTGFMGSADGNLPLWRPSSWSNLPLPTKAGVFGESGHLPLAKKLSDPADSHHDGGPHLGAPGSTGAASGNNLHKKLQRQLTLNPTFDDRLAQMRMANGPCMQTSPGQGQPPHHSGVIRLSSDGPVAGGFRAARADTSGNGPMQGYRDTAWQTGMLSNQNSTSDTGLNMYPNQFVTPTCYQPSIWSSPVAPAHGVHGVRPSSVPPQNRMRAPLVMPMASGLQAPATTGQSPFGSGMTSGSGGGLPSVGGVEERKKLYYHLASIFPEEQVKAAMDMHPEEQNPQKICATILAMFPAKS